GDFYFHYHRANLYNSEEKFSEAAAEFKKAILAEPNNSSVYADLAEVYLILGDTDKALWASECSVRLNSKGKAGVYTGIIAYELCGITHGQLPLFKFAEIWQFPEDVDFHKMRAFICFRNGLFREAVYSLKKAAALDKNPQGYFYFNIGLCYTALGDIIKTNNCMIIAESLGFKPAHEILKENFLIN
ncbi:MAG: tetratricopeptide repeat protein, partial [Ignavibacteriae bacterium]|nr:tetratricopeptide repeat protein [Ignavibacteriota bacterium]